MLRSSSLRASCRAGSRRLRLALFACGNGGFDPASKVDSVRLFAVAPTSRTRSPATWSRSRRSSPTRARTSRAAKLYWIPVLCLNPQDDLYYLCFAPPGDGGHDAGTRLVPVGPLADAGAAAGAAEQDGPEPSRANPFASIPTGVDLGPFLRRDRSSRSAFRTTL